MTRTMMMFPLALLLAPSIVGAIELLPRLRLGTNNNDVETPAFDGRMFTVNQRYLPEFSLTASDDDKDDDDDVSQAMDDLFEPTFKTATNREQLDQLWEDGSATLEEERFLNQFYSDDSSLSMYPSPAPRLQPYVGNNGRPSSAFPLGLCQGDCDSNQDCRGNLKCYRNVHSPTVPGCRGQRVVNRLGNKQDYCYDPYPQPAPKPTPKPTPRLSSVGNNGLPRYAFPLGLCQGDCDGDHDCQGNLKCFDSPSSNKVPGCSGIRPVNRQGNKEDYCYDPNSVWDSGDYPKPTPKPTPRTPTSDYEPTRQPSSSDYEPTRQPSSDYGPTREPTGGQPTTPGQPTREPSGGQPTTPGQPTREPSGGQPTTPGQPTREPTGVVPAPTSRPTPQETITPMPSVDCLSGTTKQEFLRDKLSEVTPLEILNDPTTPQGMAFNWIASDSFLDTRLCDYPTTDQRYGLVVMYYATTGAEWTNSNGWLTANSECNWFGVDCSEDGDDIFIVILNLEMNNLVGTLPDEIFTLNTLQELRLFDNTIGSSIPVTIGDLTNLERIDLESNALTGQLFTDELLGLTKLTVLRASFNLLSGSIPPEISQLSLLQQFWIAQNDFNGEIPASIGALVDLETWFIYTNGFSGELPAEMGDLQNLQQFRAHENFFEGELPGSLFDLTSLGVLRLDVNSFTGGISPSIGELTKLRTLRLELNFFTGTIPQEIGQLTELEFLLLNDQRSTRLTGNIPDVFGDFSRLEFIDLSNNALSGPIPESLFSLSTIVNVYLANNTLTGGLPATYSDPPLLRDLYLENNLLTGMIPSIPDGSLDQLNEFLVQGNLFSGTMPDSVCALRMDGTGILEDLWSDCGGAAPEIICPFPDCCTRCFVDPPSTSNLEEGIV